MPLLNFINGQFVDAQAAETMPLISPMTGQEIGQSPISGQADVDAAMEAAARAFETWKKTTPSQRQDMLLQLADALEANAEKLAEAQNRNTGQPKALIVSEEVGPSADHVRFFAGAARRIDAIAAGEYAEGLTSYVRKEPLGVVAQVTPWNYPLMMAIWKIAPALAAGNTVVLKPSDTTPESTIELARIAADIFPPGVFNVILGNASTGEMMVKHPAVAQASITGSVRAGIAVAQTAAATVKRAHLELGGKAPVIVFPGVDIAATAEAIGTAGYFNAGQDCTAATRVLVHRDIYGELLAALVNFAKTVVVGSGDDALYGPLNNANHLAKVQGMIERTPAHATIETGGKLREGSGYYFEPTVISGLRQHDELIQDEIFGPVITVQAFSSEDEALEMANDVVYGLASSVWTENHRQAERFSRELDFGCVWINTHIPLVAEMPHGGFKQSGYGKDLSVYGLDDYLRVKHVMSAH
ncbi:MAG: gamma-aminobutyraldehyde dehydrogenase [Actinomycetaceae bacterium]|nr:gamma-aminobutyraldehyde dehydrogenase [Actinomycetaceae bacterium]